MQELAAGVKIYLESADKSDPLIQAALRGVLNEPYACLEHIITWEMRVSGEKYSANPVARAKKDFEERLEGLRKQERAKGDGGTECSCSEESMAELRVLLEAASYGIQSYTNMNIGNMKKALKQMEESADVTAGGRLKRKRAPAGLKEVLSEDEVGEPVTKKSG